MHYAFSLSDQKERNVLFTQALSCISPPPIVAIYSWSLSFSVIFSPRCYLFPQLLTLFPHLSLFYTPPLFFFVPHPSLSVSPSLLLEISLYFSTSLPILYTLVAYLWVASPKHFQFSTNKMHARCYKCCGQPFEYHEPSSSLAKYFNHMCIIWN